MAGLNGRELFLKMEDGLAKLQGGLRDSTASDLFGNKLGMAMAGASEGIRGALANTEQFSHFMSTDAAHALDQYDEAIKRADKSLHAMAANLMGPVAEGFNVLFEAANKGASLWALAMGLLPKGLGLVGTGTQGLATLIDDLNRKTDANATASAAAAAGHGAVTVALTAEQQAARFLATLEANAAVALEAGQIKNLEHLKEIGQLNAKNAEGIGVSAGQFAAYTASIEAAKKAVTDLAAAQTAADALSAAAMNTTLGNLRAIETQRARSYGTRAQIDMLTQQDLAEQALFKSVYNQTVGEKERMKIIEDAGKAHLAITNQKLTLEQQLAGLVNTENQRNLDAQTRINAARGLDAAGAIMHQVGALEQLDIELKAIHLTKQDGISQAPQEQEAIDKASAALIREAQAALDANIALSKLHDKALEIPTATTPAADGLISLGNAATQAAGGFFSMSAELYNAIRAAQAADDAAHRFGHPIFTTTIGGITPPSFAQGGVGDFGSGTLAMLHGREAVIPLDRLGGGGSPITIIINGSVLSDETKIARAVKQALARDHRTGGGSIGSGAA